jgi:hypothetical protein
MLKSIIIMSSHAKEVVELRKIQGMHGPRDNQQGYGFSH